MTGLSTIAFSEPSGQLGPHASPVSHNHVSQEPTQGKDVELGGPSNTARHLQKRQRIHSTYENKLSPLSNSREEPHISHQLDKWHQPSTRSRIEFSTLNQLPPLPPRLALPNYSKKIVLGMQSEYRPKDEVQMKPHLLDPPKIAPLITNGATLDFYPWGGDQPEDTLNEQTVTSGYYDKSSVSSNESGPARPLIWSSIKHKSGLQILSSLFISSLDQRHSYSTVRTKSTFKPPPRVTLTDAKREAWLKDLADSRTPLRRLSRTIPHGIRGRSLLDQSLAKNIPTWRAVWLAKCVGANEIRATKRKGTTGAFASGGETKWVRDWTTNLQQFIESLINIGGAEEWSDKLAYGLQLVAHIYSDRLVDKDSFLEWVTMGLQNSEEINIPVWLILVKTYWNDIVKTRFRSRSLAVALSEQLILVSQSLTSQLLQIRLEANSTLWQTLSSLIRCMMVNHPESLVIHLHWVKYKTAICACVTDQNLTTLTAFAEVNIRNRRLCRDGYPAEGIPAHSTEKIIALLDASLSAFDLEHVASSCLKLAQSHKTLINVLLFWATTNLYPQISRVYVVVRLLRKLSHDGVESDMLIMSSLAKPKLLIRLDLSKIFLLVTELVRSRQFSVGKYLQWLLAKGRPITSSAFNLIVNDFHVDLLNNIPLYSLPDNVLNLRTIVMSKFSRSSGIKPQVAMGKQILLSRLRFFGKCSAPTSPELAQLKQMCGSARLEIALWVRKLSTAAFSEMPQNHPDLGNTSHSKAQELSNDDLYVVVEVLESLGDYSILADILHSFVDNIETSALCRIVDYLNYRFDIFYAIGAAAPLFNAILGRLFGYQRRMLSDRPLFISLAVLSERLPNSNKTTQRLQQEISLCEPTSALAACSPISDQMVEALHQGESTFVENIEQLFGNGTSMDRPLFTKVFHNLIEKVEWTKTRQKLGAANFTDLLSRLKSYDADFFESLITEWLNRILPSMTFESVRGVIVPLISQSMLSLETVASNVLIIHRNTAPGIPSVVVGLFNLILNWPQSTFLLYGWATGKFEAERATFIMNYVLVVSITEEVIKLSAIPGAWQEAARKEVHNPAFPGFLQQLIFRPLGHASNLNSIVVALSKSKAACSSIDAALGSTVSNVMSKEGIRELLQIVDELNIGLCQLRLLISAHGLEHSAGERKPDSLIVVLVEEAAKNFQERPGIWERMFTTFHEPVAAILHAYTLEEIFKEFPELKTNSSVHPQFQTRIRNLLAIIQVIGKHRSIKTPSSVLEDLALSLHDFLRFHLGHGYENLSDKSPYQSIAKNQSASFHLEIILELLSIHQEIIIQQTGPQSTLCRLTTSLCLILDRTKRQISSSLLHYLFDTISFISDFLSYEARTQCSQLLRDQYQVSDSQVTFLLSYSGDEQDTLSVGFLDSTAFSQAATPENSFPSHILAYSLRTWEMVQDATPVVGENDTSLSLSLFDTKKAL